MVPQNFPALTTQVGAAGGTTTDVEVLDVVLVVDVDVGGVVGFLVVTGAPPPGVRYQLASGSAKHSPAVTPFQPLALIKP